MIDAVVVLLIEDDSLGETKTGKALLQMPGIILRKASSWSMALRMMSRETELLVVDLNLPDVLDPTETADKIVSLVEKFPIVVCSDVFEFRIRQQCMDAGCVAFLKKSDTSPEELRHAVTKAILQTQRHKMDSEVTKLSTIIPDLRTNGV